MKFQTALKKLDEEKAIYRTGWKAHSYIFKKNDEVKRFSRLGVKTARIIFTDTLEDDWKTKNIADLKITG